MELQTVRAIYKNGGLIFVDPTLAPMDGAEAVLTFLKDSEREVALEVDPIQALRGRGKGEGLVEKLLQSRQKDREKDEQGHARLRA
mgnify:CR=1 FL=1